MGRYILRRLLAMIPAIAIVTLLIAGLVRLVPGDVIAARLEESGFADEAALAEMRAELGIDRPFHEQYLDWASHALRGDLGESLWSGDDVLGKIVERSKVSIQLGLMTVVISIMLALPLGIVSAVNRDGWIDYIARLFSVIGLAAPNFWLATLLILVLSVQFEWLPEFSYFVPWEDPWKNFQALIFPALILGYSGAATAARMTRSAMLEVLNEDYIRTARAKGLPERTVVVRHALRNSFIPVVTIFGSQLANLLSGLVIIESIFTLPGLGTLTLNAIQVRDYTVIQGVVLVTAVMFMLINLIVDLSYAVLDPRIRYA